MPTSTRRPLGATLALLGGLALGLATAGPLLSSAAPASGHATAVSATSTTVPNQVPDQAAAQGDLGPTMDPDG